MSNKKKSEGVPVETKIEKTDTGYSIKFRNEELINKLKQEGKLPKDY